jgi:hypothetical protein
MRADDFETATAALIDAWCGRRALRLLRTVLPHWPLVSGLTDEWADLAQALKIIRSSYPQDLIGSEMDTVVELLHAAEAIVYRS